MADGDDDLQARLRALLPPWFDDEDPVLDGLLAAIAAILGFLFSLVTYAKLQTRIATATGGWLDLIAYDFFGLRFLRRTQEADEPFRGRILNELLRPRVTRPAIVEALTDLTGRAPVILEMFNPGDCGGYGVGGLAYAGGSDAQPVGGYGTPAGGFGAGRTAYVVPNTGTVVSAGAGAYGSLEYPYQTFITAFRPATQGVPNLGGYGGFGGGYGVGALEYVDLNQTTAKVTDDEIYATVADTIPAGTIGWVAIKSGDILVDPGATHVPSPINTMDSEINTMDSSGSFF